MNSFSGSSIREYFTNDFGTLFEDVTYTFDAGGSVVTDLYCEERVGEVENGMSVRQKYHEVIVGKDHVPDPSGGDSFVHDGATYYAFTIFEEDTDSARMGFEVR